MQVHPKRTNRLVKEVRLAYSLDESLLIFNVGLVLQKQLPASSVPRFNPHGV